MKNLLEIVAIWRKNYFGRIVEKYLYIKTLKFKILFTPLDPLLNKYPNPYLLE